MNNKPPTATEVNDMINDLSERGNEIIDRIRNLPDFVLTLNALYNLGYTARNQLGGECGINDSQDIKKLIEEFDTLIKQMRGINTRDLKLF